MRYSVAESPSAGGPRVRRADTRRVGREVRLPGARGQRTRPSHREVGQGCRRRHRRPRQDRDPEPGAQRTVRHPLVRDEVRRQVLSLAHRVLGPFIRARRKRSVRGLASGDTRDSVRCPRQGKEKQREKEINPPVLGSVRRDIRRGGVRRGGRGGTEAGRRAGGGGKDTDRGGEDADRTGSAGSTEAGRRKSGRRAIASREPRPRKGQSFEAPGLPLALRSALTTSVGSYSSSSPPSSGTFSCVHLLMASWNCSRSRFG